MKQSRLKVLSLVMAAVLCMTLLPVTALAAGGDAMTLGASSIDSGDHIYYGSYNSEPIQWRVLDTQTNTEDEGLFLLSEKLLGTDSYGGVKFNESGNSNNWQGSDAQAWCQSFYTSSFSQIEQGTVLATTKSDDAFTSSTYSVPFKAADNILNGDKVFFLSAEEAENSEYGFTDDSARIANYGDSAGVWWLRSPYGDIDPYAGAVYLTGCVEYFEVPYVWAARPAFNLNLDSVLFASAAEGGKSSGAAGVGALQEITGSAPDKWKLTLLDSDRTFSVSDAEIDDDTISFSYADAETGANEYLSAVIVDNGSITHYGRVMQLDGTTNGASGTASITLPTGVTLGDGVELKVFNEQYNGDKKTDYASELKLLNPTPAEENKLVSITDPADITNLANGTEKTAEALGLPKTVGITTSTGTPTEAEVTWKVDECSYDPANESAQAFDVSGMVTLPDGITNPDNVPLDVTISVTVSAKPALEISSITIKTQPGKTSYTEGDTLDLTGLEITIGYSGGDSKDVPFNDFSSNGVSTSPAHGAPLTTTDTSVTVSVGAYSDSFDITVTKATEPSPGTDDDDKPSRPSGGDSDSHPDDDNYDFWDKVKQKVEDAEPGETIKVNARSYDKFPYDLMEALYDRGDVSLEIRWDGGDTFIIPAGQALKPAKNRIFYRLEYLAEQYKDAQAAAPAPEENPAKLNPNTGAGSFWDYLAFLFHSIFDAA